MPIGGLLSHRIENLFEGGGESLNHPIGDLWGYLLVICLSDTTRYAGQGVAVPAEGHGFPDGVLKTSRVKESIPTLACDKYFELIAIPHAE